VNGWDVSGKTGIQFEAKDDVVSSEVNGDLSGARILNSALGARKQAIAHAVPLNSSEAQAEAEAYFRTFVDLQGLGPMFSGKYYLAQVRYVFDGVHGMRVEFAAERAGLGQAS
jgi:hypothetical protein